MRLTAWQDNYAYRTLCFVNIMFDTHHYRFHGSARYWEKDVEFDVVREAPISSREGKPEGGRTLFIGEAKLKILSAAQRKLVLRRLAETFQRSNLRRRYDSVGFEVFDATSLETVND